LKITITSEAFIHYISIVTRPKPQQAQKAADFVAGHVLLVTIYASSAGKACIVSVELPDNQPNKLGLPPGTDIELLAPNETFCTLSGLSKIGKLLYPFFTYLL
jgi:hypothetical protein